MSILIEPPRSRAHQPRPQVDHFDHQNEDTFRQLYYVNDTFWNPSLPGPVFLDIGGEGPLSPLDVSYFQEANYAQRFGALLVCTSIALT